MGTEWMMQYTSGFVRATAYFVRGSEEVRIFSARPQGEPTLLRSPQREADAERTAAPYFRFDFDNAAVVADDAETDRQPQAGTLPHRLGREERLENVRQIPPA